jgi:acylglycerol lipase
MSYAYRPAPPGRRRLLAGLCGLPLIAACAPTVLPAGAPVRTPSLTEDIYTAADGTRLPARVWPAAGGREPSAVMLAVHGFGDYRISFEAPAAIWAEAGYETWTWDQRGFGASPTRGRWAGVATMADDLRTMARLVHTRRPGVPLIVVGESMGGALLLVVLGAPEGAPPDIARGVLVAPAARTRESAGPLASGALDVVAHSVPWLPVGPTSIDFRPTDNRALLERLRNDPLMLYNPRVDVVYGLVDLMDAAYAAAPRARGPLLVLYGLGDRVVPSRPTSSLVRRLPATPPPRLALYEKGYHMLFRDLQGDVPARDVAAWIADPAAPLPSGADGAIAAAPDKP